MSLYTEEYSRRSEKYFKDYTKFQQTCAEKGIHEKDVPILWSAYQLTEIERYLPGIEASLLSME